MKTSEKLKDLKKKFDLLELQLLAVGADLRNLKKKEEKILERHNELLGQKQKLVNLIMEELILEADEPK
jgi:hypothetical protein